MFTFPEQMPGEKVLMVIRKHPIVYFKVTLAFVIVFVLPFILFLSIWFSQPSLSGNLQNNYVVGVFSIAYLLFGMLFFVIAWLNEAFDLFILTDERLLDITQETLLKRNTASTPLVQIQDTSGVVSGFFPTLLNYGNVDVQTAAAGNASDFFIDHVPDPSKVAHEILNYARARKAGEEMNP